MPEIILTSSEGVNIVCPKSLQIHSNVLSDMLIDFNYVSNSTTPIPFPRKVILLLIKLLDKYLQLKYPTILRKCSLFKKLRNFYLCDLLRIIDYLDVGCFLDYLIFHITLRHKEGKVGKHEYEELYQRYNEKFDFYNKYDHCPYSLLDYMSSNNQFTFEGKIIDLRNLGLDNLIGFHMMIIKSDVCALDLSGNKIVNFMDDNGGNCFDCPNASKISSLAINDIPLIDLNWNLPNLRNLLYFNSILPYMDIYNYTRDRKINWWQSRLGLVVLNNSTDPDGLPPMSTYNGKAYCKTTRHCELKGHEGYPCSFNKNGKKDKNNRKSKDINKDLESDILYLSRYYDLII